MEEVKNYTTGQVEEELYANIITVPANTTTPITAESGTIRDGYNAVIVSLALDNTVAVCRAFIKINGKQHYMNGLAAKAFPSAMEETGLYIPLKQGDKWELGFTNVSGSAVEIAYRFRIRLFKR